MAWVETLSSEVQAIIETKWNERSGTVIPEPEDVALADGAVKITATFLYADLAGSSVLARTCPWGTTAKIIRCYLDICTRLIRAYGGEIRSFDGDRVMGIFKTAYPNTHAIKCAREIDWMVNSVLNPKATANFASIKNNAIRIKHCIGIDTGEVVAVRAGIRNNNDLIWIGRAPSFAAKLSDIRKYPFEVYISKASYDKGVDEKIDGNIWEEATFDYSGKNETVYRTKIPLKP